MSHGKLKILIGIVLSLWMGAAQAQSPAPASSKWKFEGGGGRYLYLLPGCTLTVQKSGDGFVFVPDSETRFQFWGQWPTEAKTVEFPIVNWIQNTTTGQSTASPTEFRVTFAKSVGGEILPVSYKFSYKIRNFDFFTKCQGMTPTN